MLYNTVVVLRISALSTSACRPSSPRVCHGHHASNPTPARRFLAGPVIYRRSCSVGMPDAGAETSAWKPEKARLRDLFSLLESGDVARARSLVETMPKTERLSLLSCANPWGILPMHYACLSGRADAVSMLLEHVSLVTMVRSRVGGCFRIPDTGVQACLALSRLGSTWAGQRNVLHGFTGDCSVLPCLPMPPPPPRMT